MSGTYESTEEAWRVLLSREAELSPYDFLKKALPILNAHLDRILPEVHQLVEAVAG